MGINPRDLPPAARRAVSKAITGQRQLLRPIHGSVRLWIPGEPPTVTHQAKDLAIRPGKGGRRTPRLIDRPALTAAIEQYMAKVPQNARGPVQPPLSVQLSFVWTSTDPAAPAWAPMTDKPDWDNASKTLVDVLVKRGWIHRDEQIWCGTARKYLIGKTAVLAPGVLVWISTDVDLLKGPPGMFAAGGLDAPRIFDWEYQ